MGNCFKSDEYLIPESENTVQLFSSEHRIEYDGYLNKKGQYEGYGKQYNHSEGIIRDGLFEKGEFKTGYIKYLSSEWTLDRIEYYDNGKTIRLFY